LRGGNRRDAAVSAVSQDDTTIEQLDHSVAGHDDVVAVTRPALRGDDHAAPVSADDDLGVDAAPVVLAGAVIDWSWTGMSVRSMIHRWVLCPGRVGSARASTGTRWRMVRSTADWLVVNSAASARVVRLVRTLDQHQAAPALPAANPRAFQGVAICRVGSGRR
jgi:hypothetical protein